MKKQKKDQQRKPNLAAAYLALVLKAAAVVAISVWAAWAVEPLLHEEHAVLRHNLQLSPHFMRNGQGLWLHHTAWLPETDSIKGVMFYAHGLGDHCGRYHEYATLWTNHSFAVFCLDHQGHGLSEGERAYVEKFDHYVADYNQYVDDVLQRHNLHHLPRFLSGSSMGGTIATLVANENPTRFNGVILLAPAIIPDPRSVAPWQIEAAKLFSRYVPKLPVGGLDDAEMVTDQDQLRSFLADPVVHQGMLTARWGAEMLGAMERIKDEAATRTTYPFLIIYGTEDVATNMQGGEWLVQNAKNCKDKQSKVYDGYRHALLQEPTRQTLFTELVEWVKSRI